MAPHLKQNRAGLGEAGEITVKKGLQWKPMVDLLIEGGECRAATTGDSGLASHLRFPVSCYTLTLTSMLVNSAVAEGERDFPSSLHPSPKI